LCLFFAAVISLGLAPCGVRAQVVIPAEALSTETAVTQVIQRGQALESEQRWSEALAHYEEAIRDYPERTDLWDRLTLARMHYDLGRRHEDQSFTGWLQQLSEREALDVYSEVLRKIESYYVKQPSWQELAQRGLDNLEIALALPVFRQSQQLRGSEDTIRAFSDRVQRRMKVTTVRNQREACEVATTVAKLAEQELGLRPAATVLEFTSGAVCALDQYSCFLTGGQLDEVFSQIEGNFVGLGIELRAQDKSLLIVNVLPGGPAQASGIRNGDRIVEVDGLSVSQVSTDEAADMLKGPDGSAVEVALVDSAGNRRQVRIVRRRVEVPSVQDVKIVDAQYGVGYLRLTSFQKTTAREFDEALWQLHRQGMKSLLVDVRGNPGGLLPAAVEVADKFVTAGTIVSTRGRNSHEDFDYQAHAFGTWQVPLVVLIDGDTASASEIFAGAIHDLRRGTVVGQRSYGKGSVQGIFALNSSKVGVRLTTAKFYSPGGHAIAHNGVYPDVVVRTTKKPVTAGLDQTAASEDPTLTAALQVARNSLLSQRQAAAP
jgi:carboxyl-terminal processing protease